MISDRRLHGIIMIEPRIKHTFGYSQKTHMWHTMLWKRQMIEKIGPYSWRIR